MHGCTGGKKIDGFDKLATCLSKSPNPFEKNFVELRFAATV